jgi:hypothetical protein
MSNIRVTLEATQIIKHTPMLIQELSLGDGSLDLMRIVEEILKVN